MKPRGSLRRHLFFGASLWTIGLFIAAGIVITHVLYNVPRAPRMFHDPFTHKYAGSALALLCLGGGLALVRKGLSAVDALRTDLAKVRDGVDHRLDGKYPSEVQPLVEDLNVLLEHRERAVARALAKAGDLAHGLKTPLAVLTQEAEHLHAGGHHDLATMLDAQLDRMRRQIDYHLAHARAAASGATLGARCAVLESAEGLSRTLLRLHAARGVTIEVCVPSEHVVRSQREDLDEMLGNLLDNACKWARTRVAIASTIDDGHVVITVDDDGAGIDPSLREAVLQRGVRADEAGPGSGLGLAIVRDLAELYGGSITLTASPLGGLQARLRLPGEHVNKTA